MNILYMAVSVDGFIAGSSGETPWSNEEWKSFKSFVKTCDFVLLGKNTYEVMRKNNEFIDDVSYIVVTNDLKLDTGTFTKLPITKKSDIPSANRVGIIGGGDCSGRLALLGAIDEIILDVEPIILGDGIKLFGNHNVKLDLELLETKKISDSTIQNHYKVRY